MEDKVNNVYIKFLGAAGTVTGSKHLLVTPELTILIDCGLFQGLKSLRLKNRAPLPVDPSVIDVVLLTHGHLDHSGYIPLLVKNGYKGQVYCSEPTEEVSRLILLDSARIQEEDAEEANRLKYSKHDPALPLYTVKDAESALEKFVPVKENQWTRLSDNIEFRMTRNGHILGSCFIELRCYGRTIVFSGDIGRMNSRYLYPPSIISKADYLVMESTYGNRMHPESDGENELADIINATLERQGNILVPSFAVGRTQELLLMINELKETKQIPDIDIFLDSPMAIDATKLLSRFPEWHKVPQNDVGRLMRKVTLVRDSRDTRKIVEASGSRLVIAASGMLTGGRVLEYLKKYLPEEKNVILIAGYQSEGTRGRALREGATEIKIHGNYYQVHAQVSEISSLSAHADQGEMLSWLRMFSTHPSRIFLVHGEPSALDAFRLKIYESFNQEPVIPVEGEEHILFNIG